MKFFYIQNEARFLFMVPLVVFLSITNLEGVRHMPKMGIAVDETTRNLLRKHGGQRHIGALIGRMVRLYDNEEAFGLYRMWQTLDRIEDHIMRLQDRKEECREH